MKNPFKALLPLLIVTASLSAAAVECPKALVDERPADDFECKTAGPTQWDGAEAELINLSDKKAKKKKPELYLVMGDKTRALKLDPKVAAETAAKAFAKAYPMAVDSSALRQLLKSEFKSVGTDVCLNFLGPAAVLMGEAQICNESPQKITFTTAAALVPAAVSLPRAKTLTLKEFARLEKEEEVPAAKEIFGDPDTVSRLLVGADLHSSLYYFWINLFSKNGVALIAVSLDGQVKSEVIDGNLEYSAATAEARIRKWK